MVEPMTGKGSQEWRLRICRPTFQDFQRILPRYYQRSELNGQLHKLRWWNSDERLVIDLPWNGVPTTELAELFVDLGGEVADRVRILFFEDSPHPTAPTLWILGGMRADEEFGRQQQAIYLGRSTIVKERAG